MRSGYKETEVGVIPEEWEATTIGDVASFSGGSQPPRFTFRFMPTNGYIRLIQIRDYKTDDFATFIPESLARKRCTANDIMIGRYGPPIFQILRGLDGAYNVALIKSTPSAKIDREYFFNVLKQDSLFRLIESLSRRSSGQTGVEIPALKDFGLPLPPIVEQRAIAKALSDVDALIGTLEQLIAKKRDLKIATMQQLLTGHKRLPGFSGKWETRKLGDVGQCFAGGTPSTFNASYWGGIYIWLPSGRVQNNIIRKMKDEITITQRGLDESAAKLIKSKSVLIAITGATCGNIGLLEFEAAANQSVVAIEPYGNYDYRFLYYSLLMKRAVILSGRGGSAQGGVNLATVKNIEAMFPIKPEQVAIASVLSDMDTEIELLEQKLAKYRMIKQGMMQELLTGRTRLV